jgi:hypothetical protein
MNWRWKAGPAGESWPVVVLATAIYVITLYRYSALLFQDYPNHLARSVVLSDLWFHHGARFGRIFEFRGIAYPYIAADLLLAPLVACLGAPGATFVWTALALLALPCAVLFYLHATEAPEGSRAIIFLIALYLSADAFFFLGFINFHLSIALTIAALGMGQILRRRLSPMLFLIYCLMVAFGYLMHLAFLVFAAVALGTSGLFRLWRRATTVGREFLLLLPLALAAIWYVIVPRLYPFTREVTPTHLVRAGLHTKLRQLDWPFVHFNESADLLFAAAFALLLLWAARHKVHRSTVLRVTTWEPVLLVLVFCGLYLLLPSAIGDPTHIDVRAIPLLPVFAAIWCASLPGDATRQEGMDSPIALAGAVLVLAGHLVYVCLHLAPERAWLRQYRAVVAAIPSAALVLPIYTGVHTQEGRPNLDAAAFVLMDRDALEPYLFSGDQGQPMKYFRYRQHPYAPDRIWYTLAPPGYVDWASVACIYDFLLVMKPYAPARIGLRARIVAEDSSAALLAPQRTACRASEADLPRPDFQGPSA